MSNLPAGMEFRELMVEGDTSLDTPDLGQERLDRLERNRLVMKALDAGITRKLYPQNEKPISEEERAAIIIQKYFRGYMDRQKYVDLLYQRFVQEEESQRSKTERQVEEGELLIENHQLEVLLDDDVTKRRNKARHYLADVITIQRAWRTYVRRKSERSSSIENQDNPDIDDTEKDIGTEKGETKQTEVIQKTKTKGRGCDIETASFVNDRTVSTSDLKLSTDKSCANKLADDKVKIVVKQDIRTPDSFSVSSDSTPEENTQHHTHDSTPEDDRVYLGHSVSSQRLHTLAKLKQEGDGDCVSIASDYSEVSVPLRELAESEVEIVQKADLEDKSFKPSPSVNSVIHRNPEETDEEFSKRVRKTNLLSIAQEFADLKKANAKALPLGLHRGYIGESSSSENSSRQSSEMNTPSDVRQTFIDDNVNVNNRNIQDSDLNSNVADTSSQRFTDRISDVQNDNEKIQTTDADTEGDFDVYNIETTVPNIDWDTLEQQLQQATQDRLSNTQRNDREEIRKKLAMATDVEEDCFSEDKSYKKASSSRALTGKNLQICFMNEDQDQDVQQSESSAGSDQQKKSTNTVPKPQNKSKEPVVTKETTKKEEKEEDFFQRQARLQTEAKMALAQASTMAHMQLEVERQKKKKSSPIADIVGIPYIGDSRRRRVSLKMLYEMNVAQLQVVVNDLHTQIENLNEELVRLLMERDELHMSQDSMLVDIEDLTRRAEETAVRVNTKQTKTHSKS